MEVGNEGKRLRISALTFWQVQICPNINFNKKFALGFNGLRKFDPIFASKLSLQGIKFLFCS